MSFVSTMPVIRYWMQIVRKAYPQSGMSLRLRWRRLRGPRGSSPSGAPLRGRGLRRLWWRISRWTPGVGNWVSILFIDGGSFVGNLLRMSSG